MARQVEEAFENLIVSAAPLPAEHVPAPAALGRIAAADVKAPRQLPGFRRAAMDGFVCHDADVAQASPARPVRLRLTGEIRMGEPPLEGPAPGEAWSIMTGGAMPLRGDRVVPLEYVRRDGEMLLIAHAPAEKRHIAEAGEDLPTGALLATAGQSIGPVAVGAMVGAGIRAVAVHRRPRVALISTGDELVEGAGSTEAPPPGRIFNTNVYVLKGELEAIGCSVDYHGIVRDQRERFSAVFKEAVDAGYDMILSTGGVSVGPHDKVPRAWLDLGAKRIVGRVDLKPGGPFFAGLLGSAWAIGLSGGPAASLAAYHLFVRPLACRLSGRSSFVRPIVMVTLASAFDRRTDRFRALWSRVEIHGSKGLRAEILTDRALGIIGGMIRANGLLLLRPGTPALERGSQVPALLLDRIEDRQEFVVPPVRSAPLVVGVVGASGEGKTTVIAGLLQRLTAAGVRALAIKHAPHGFEMDRAGSDTARMFGEGADAVLVVGPGEAAVRVRLNGRELEREDAIEMAVSAAMQVENTSPQIVLVEGFKHSDRPVIVVGASKPGAEHENILTDFPAVTTIDPRELEDSLDVLATQLAERVR